MNKKIIVLPGDGIGPEVVAQAEKVIKAIQENGFYLQLPPPPINHLEEHKKYKKRLQKDTQ